jgi:hypothetical protein
LCNPTVRPASAPLLRCIINGAGIHPLEGF